MHPSVPEARHDHHNEKRSKQFEFKRRAVERERKVRTADIKKHRLVNHRKFKMRFRVIERNAAVLGKENGDKREKDKNKRNYVIFPIFHANA